jgi:uncharacterized membrane protein YedE/YeeE
MYGIIGTAVGISMVFMFLFKRKYINDYTGNPILPKTRKKEYIRTLVGGIIFGLGWALAGSCPAPIFVLIGNGIISIIVVLIGALIGAFIYGLLNKKLPH